MKIFKKISSIFLALILVFAFTTNVFAANDPVPISTKVSFIDIAGSPYEAAINKLLQAGIVEETKDKKFYPETNLTKAEAATFISRAFKIVEITPMIWKENPDLQKENAYDDPLKPITEAFTVPSAKDIVNHTAYKAIEGIFNARIDTVSNRTYLPNASISTKDFCTMLAKAYFGPDKKIDFLAKGVEAGLFTEEESKCIAPISHEFTAYLIANAVLNNNFKTVTAFVTSDIHGNLLPYTPSGSKVAIGSVARMAKIINDFRDKYGEVTLLDCGDSPYNTNIANLFEGLSTVTVMNVMGYDATAMGNHDFDYAFSILQRNASVANYEFLSNNTVLKNGKTPDFMKPYIILDIQGVKIGVAGFTDDTSKLYTHWSNTTDIDFLPDIEAAKKTVAELEPKTDVIIALSHLHNKNPEAAKIQGIDITVGGGNDLAGPPTLFGDNYMINPGKHAEALNQININLLNNKIVGINVSQIFISQNLPEDPGVAAVVKSFEKNMDKKFKVQIGTAGVDLDGERGTVRLKESNLADEIADSQREFLGADIAFQNGGGVRASIKAGKITVGDIISILPFDNKLMKVEVDGKTVWEALENGVKAYPNAAGQFLQVSGIKYTFDPSKEVGSRIVDVTMSDGTKLDLNKKYTVVINDFMAGGGDGYSMLKCTGVGEMDPDVKLLLSTNYYLRDVFREYVEAKGTISPAISGRITIIQK